MMLHTIVIPTLNEEAEIQLFDASTGDSGKKDSK